MVGGVLAHADFPPGCGVVTNTLPKPVHFDDSEHQWVIGAVASGFDVETVALHELGHILGLQHSDVAGSVMFPSVSSNSTKRVLTADDLGGIRELYPASLLAAGTYTIRQKSNGRFLDAHEIADQDFRLVTRPAQNNDTQRWELAPVGAVYAIRQKSNGRFLDAHENAGERLPPGHPPGAEQRHPTVGGVCRSAMAAPRSGSSATCRFVDAHEIADEDFRLVTRTAQNNDTQRWLLDNVGANTFTVRQKSNGRFVDAHELAGEDFRWSPARPRTTTRNAGSSPRWEPSTRSARRATAASWTPTSIADEDFRLVTRPAQNNDTQRWVVLPVGDGSFTIQQLSNGRFVDAHESAANDFSVGHPHSPEQRHPTLAHRQSLACSSEQRRRFRTATVRER